MTKWTVIDAPQRDIGRGVVRIDPPAMEALNVGVGDAVWVRGERDAIARVMPSLSEHRGKSHAQMDGTVRENARVGLGDTVEILRADVRPAKRVELMPTGPKLRDEDLGFVGHRVDGIPVQRDDQLFVPLFGTRAAEFLVINTEPSGPVLVNENTTMVVHESKDADPAPAGPKVAFEDVGGLGGQLAKIRETIELPLRHPEIFRRLGIDPPRGVLLHGPPGCGKTLVARMIAREADAAFFVISGPEIIHKHYGESEAHLRRVFDEAAKRKPAIIFLDEVDAIAPRREDAAGDVERRVVATLLTLMDGLKDRGNLIVIAATNRPNAIDPALRRPGRFDREIAIPVPDRAARAQILAIHTRGMPLEPDVDLGAVADTTHGFVGADLEALCREAALACLRRVLPNLAVDGRFSPSSLRQLNVCHDDFDNALREVQPSATREVFVDVPNVSWDDVGGLKPIKTLLLEAVEWPIVHADLFASANVRAPRGILLCGPPGCGKTLLAKAVASQTQANFIAIKGPDIIDKYVGESERRLRETFRKARSIPVHCVL
ncbi:MAG: AAA family ATPase [bacterium]